MTKAEQTRLLGRIVKGMRTREVTPEELWAHVERLQWRGPINRLYEVLARRGDAGAAAIVESMREMDEAIASGDALEAAKRGIIVGRLDAKHVLGRLERADLKIKLRSGPAAARSRAGKDGITLLEILAKVKAKNPGRSVVGYAEDILADPAGRKLLLRNGKLPTPASVVRRLSRAR